MIWRRRYKHRQMLWHWLLRNDVAPVDYSIVRYGSDYGGWNLPSELITSDWLVYDFGVGEDISFDIALLEQRRCTIQAFDPTPKAIAFVENVSLPGFHFHPLGVWNEDTTIKFWHPRGAADDSYSALNLHSASEYIEGEVKTIRSLAKDLGHEQIDLIKMDIEGAEQLVIPNLIADGIRPTLLCVEYDQSYEVVSLLSLRTLMTSFRLHRAVLKAGYRLIDKSGWNATYLLSS
ncbi:MAG: FkbM family methyltransferase [Chloroflexi bacterium]|nr:FkbM family methyltransferase [Chloroflexota bacterium]